ARTFSAAKKVRAVEFTTCTIAGQVVLEVSDRRQSDGLPESTTKGDFSTYSYWIAKEHDLRSRHRPDGLPVPTRSGGDQG
nr:hypothetical protein [Actinomycetota bacterium]